MYKIAARLHCSAPEPFKVQFHAKHPQCQARRAWPRCGRGMESGRERSHNSQGLLQRFGGKGRCHQTQDPVRRAHAPRNPLSGVLKAFIRFFISQYFRIAMGSGMTEVSYVLQSRGCKPGIQQSALACLTALISACITEPLSISLLPGNEKCPLPP